MIGVKQKLSLWPTLELRKCFSADETRNQLKVYVYTQVSLKFEQHVDCQLVSGVSSDRCMTNLLIAYLHDYIWARLAKPLK